jgi:hypothetical protein
LIAHHFSKQSAASNFELMAGCTLDRSPKNVERNPNNVIMHWQWRVAKASGRGANTVLGYLRRVDAASRLIEKNSFRVNSRFSTSSSERVAIRTSASPLC